jgi:hypothetical protein
MLDVRIKNKRTEIAGKQERNRGEIIDWKKRERKDERWRGREKPIKAKMKWKQKPKRVREEERRKKKEKREMQSATECTLTAPRR